MISNGLSSLAEILTGKGVHLQTMMDRNKQFSKFLNPRFGNMEESIERLGELVAADLMFYKNKVIPFVKTVQDEFNVAFANSYTSNMSVDLEIAPEPSILELIKERLKDENKPLINNPENYTPIVFDIGNLDEITDLKSLFLLADGGKINDYVNVVFSKKTTKEMKELILSLNQVPLNNISFKSAYFNGNPSLASNEECVTKAVLLYSFVKNAELNNTAFNSGFDGTEAVFGTIYNHLLQSLEQTISYYSSLKNNGIVYLNSLVEKDELEKTNFKVVVIEQNYLEYVEKTKDHPKSVDALLGLHKNCNPSLPRLDSDTIAGHIDQLAEGYLKLINSGNAASTNSRVQSSKSILLDAFRNAFSLLPEEVKAEIESAEGGITNFILHIERALNDHYNDFIDNDIYKIILVISDNYVFKGCNIVEFALELDRASNYCQNPEQVNVGLLNKIAITNILIKKLLLENVG